MELSGNILILQSGTSTVAANAILAGLVSESLNHEAIEEVYGVIGGFQGVLKERFIDLADESQQVIRGLRYTPGSALGMSTDGMQSEEEMGRFFQVLEAHEIKYVFTVGDSDCAKHTKEIADAATAKGIELRILNVPQSLHNDLPITDHCIGYGSAIKYLCTHVKVLANHALSEGLSNKVHILEVEGGPSGWLVAGTTLSKFRNKPEDAPHIVCLPEVRFHANTFLEEVRNVMKQQRHCVIAVNATLFDDDGNFLGADAAGVKQMSSARYLASIIQENLGFDSEILSVGEHFQIASWLASGADNDEAYLSGTAAVKAAVSGVSGKAISLSRSDGEGYQVETALLDLQDMLGENKAFPKEWIHENGISLRHQFYKYAIPFIQEEVEVPFDNGLPQFVRLSKNRVEKKLENFATV